MIKVSLSSVQPLTALGLRQLIDGSSELALAEPVIENPASAGPDVVVHCVERDHSQLRAISESARSLPVLVIGDDSDLTAVDRYFSAGALGYLHLSTPLNMIVDAVCRVARHRRVVRLSVPEMDPREAVPDATSPLSDREREVLEHIALGRTHDQAARALGLSRHTVDTYVKRARRKLQAGNKADLTRAVLAL